jgi:hypothetical protein
VRIPAQEAVLHCDGEEASVTRGTKHVVDFIIMPIVYYDEEDSEAGDEASASAMFLVCFELAMLIGMYYMMFLAPLSLAWF